MAGYDDYQTEEEYIAASKRRVTMADTKELVARLRKASRAIYLATEEAVADDISSKLTRAADTIERLERERDEARGIVRDIHWMAVRYADNRKSYAVGMCNDALRKAYDGGWLVYSDTKQLNLDPQYARNGLFDVEWRSAVDNATARAEAAEAEASTLRARVARLEEALKPFADVAACFPKADKAYPHPVSTMGVYDKNCPVYFRDYFNAYAALTGEQQP